MRFHLRQSQMEASKDETGFLLTNNGDDEIGAVRRVVVYTDHQAFEFQPKQLSMRGKSENITVRNTGFWGWLQSVIWGPFQYNW